MNSNENNTYNAQGATTLPEFWRDTTTWRTTGTGMNQNVISKRIPYKGKREYLDQFIDNKLYFTTSERKKRKIFIETVNDCLGDIYSCGRGFVFTDEQLLEVKRMLPKARCSWNNDICCYSCRR